MNIIVGVLSAFGRIVTCISLAATALLFVFSLSSAETKPDRASSPRSIILSSSLQPQGAVPDTTSSGIMTGSVGARQTVQPALASFARIDSLVAEARSQYRYGRFESALSLANRSAVLSRRTYGPNSASEAVSLALLGDIHAAERRYLPAEKFYLRALSISGKKSELGLSFSGALHHSLGLLHAARGMDNRAESSLRKALEEREKHEGAYGDGVASTLTALGHLYNRAGKQDLAMMYYSRALSIREKQDDSGRLIAELLPAIAGIYSDAGYYDMAIQLYQRSLVMNEKTKGIGHPDVALSLNGLAAVSAAQGRFAAATLFYERSVGVLEKSLGREHPDVAATLKHLASVNRRLERFDEAEGLMRRSLAITEKHFSASHRNVGGALNSLALIYSSKGDYAAAEPLFMRSLAIVGKRSDGSREDMIQVLENMAEMYHKWGRIREAENHAARAMKLRKLAEAGR